MVNENLQLAVFHVEHIPLVLVPVQATVAATVNLDAVDLESRLLNDAHGFSPNLALHVFSSQVTRW
jgi:hypothetical protein